MSPANTLDLTGRVALITGASRGIGRETALRMAQAGARVVVHYHRGAAQAQEVVDSIGTPSAAAIRADVSRPLEVESLVEGAIDRFGRLDIVVNNAASCAENRFDGADYQAWQRGWQETFSLNVFGAANVAFLAMRWMRGRGGGKIINVSSRAAFRGETEFPDYGASKAALVNLTRSMARACAADGIVTSCVAPGFVETEMARPLLDRDRESIVAQIPLGRVGSVEDVASVILFLASPLADYLNGVTVDVNGGSWFH